MCEAKSDPGALSLLSPKFSLLLPVLCALERLGDCLYGSSTTVLHLLFLLTSGGNGIAAREACERYYLFAQMKRPLGFSPGGLVFVEWPSCTTSAIESG
jgi:hypothetical protein